MSLEHNETHIEVKFYEAVFPNLHYSCQLLPQHDEKINKRITFRADFVMHTPAKKKNIIFECDGIENHRGWENEHYDNLRDAVLLLNGNCSHVIRISGRGIQSYIHICLSYINKVLNAQNIPFLIESSNINMQDVGDLVTIHDRKWLTEYGILREAKWVIEQSDCPFYEAHAVFLKVIEQNL